MSRIKNAFADGCAFIGFITAGDPDLECTEIFIEEMEKGGADLIEIGIPFSDPIAEGPVIQDADIRALKSETTTDKIFDMVTRVRKNTDIPLVFLTYYNPVFHYGAEKFFMKCSQCGADGIIIPDLPFEERSEISDLAKENGIDIISLIAPTSDERIQKIAVESEGFIYIVSSMGVTGVRSEIKTDLKSMISSVKAVADIPCAVGFGINTPEQAEEISQYSDGIIVGSAIVRIIEKYGKNSGEYINKYVKTMKNAIKNRK